MLPLAYAVWTAFHPAEFSTRFALLAPLTLENFARAWDAAPFARYFLNTFVLVTLMLACQLVLCTLAAYAFARFEFRRQQRRVRAGAGAAHDHAGRADRRELPHDEPRSASSTPFPAIALPYWRPPSASSCCARPSRPCRKELDDAARVEGASAAADAAEGLRAAGAADLPRLRRSSRSAITGTISCGR